MKTAELKKGIYYTGVTDKDLRTFDIIMETKYGTSYNSYIVKGNEKTALIETAKENFLDEYLENVDKITPLSEINYLVVNHTEPDHSGSIRALLEHNPEMTVVGTPSALMFLKEITNKTFNKLSVKEGDSISLGDKTLTFMPLPNLHWPDTMYTYIPEDKTLFTCDSFGAHYAHDGILRSSVTDTEGYLDAAKYYFDCILGPFKQPFMQNALERIKDLDIELIATGHGPVLDSHIEEIIEYYKDWCKPEKNEKKTVIIAYVSAYGYTKLLAEKIHDGLAEDGRLCIKMFDLEKAPKNQVVDEITKADGFLLGSPTILGDALEPVWDVAIALFPPIHSGKLATAFGSYGWSGEAVPNLLERFKQLRLKTIEGMKVRFRPSEEDLEKAKEFGRAFAAEIK